MSKINTNEETKTKSMKGKLLKTLNMSQLLGLRTYNQNIIIWEMGENSSSWTKFNTLRTTIFSIYNFSILDIKVVAIHKS